MKLEDKSVLLFYLFIRQMSGIADCLRHLQSKRQGVEYSDTERRTYTAYLKTELADNIQLTKRMCSAFNLDYSEVEILGKQRDIEKREEYLERHPGAEWV